MNCTRLILILLNVCFLCIYCSPLLESSSFAFCWQNPFVEFLVELFSDSIWTENKHYYHLLSKLIVLSLLSTTIGPEHEPLLRIGVVHPQHMYFTLKTGREEEEEDEDEEITYTFNSVYNEVTFNEKLAIRKEHLCTKYFPFTYK